MPRYARIAGTSFGQITVGKKTHEHDVYLLADGRLKKRKKKLAKQAYGTSHKIGPKELQRLCRDDPDVLFIATGQYGAAELTDEGQRFLRQRGVEFQVLPTPQAVEAYNGCDRRKAALVHVTC
jgi:hypothetical protein